MLVAILSDKDPAKRIKMVDVDCNGRACPELNTTLTAYWNHPPKPMGLGSLHGDEVAVIRSATFRRANCACAVYAVWHAYRFLHMGHEQGRDA